MKLRKRAAMPCTLERDRSGGDLGQIRRYAGAKMSRPHPWSIRAQFHTVAFRSIEKPQNGPNQKMNRAPNWICRSADSVAVIEPKFGLVIVPFGVANVVWLKMLKNSARNWNFKNSVNSVSLTTEKSKFHQPGPVAVLRPRFPGAVCSVLPAAFVPVGLLK